MRRLRNFLTLKGDKVLWIFILVLMFASIVLIYSSTGRLSYNKQAGDTLFYVGKQLTFIILSLGVLCTMQVFSWRRLYKWAPILLVIAGILLVMAAFGGSHINGAGRWIKIPIIGLTFQPSEFAKIAIVIYVSKLLSDYQEERWCNDEILKQLWAPAAIILLIFWDNFSTSVLITGVCVCLFILGRMRWKLLGKMVGVLVGLLGVLIILGLTFPGVTNKLGRVGTIVGRLTAFVDKRDANEEGKKDYNMQSDHACMAIAQGGLTGRGPGNSIQRNMLPHAYSDFIFAILIEEYGILGALLILACYMIILYRSVKIGLNALKSAHLNPRGAPELFPTLLVFGLGISITLQTLIHMGVNTGALPVTGQTLPLVSLGGTSMLFISAALGIILNVAFTFSSEYQEQNEETQETGSDEYFQEESLGRMRDESEPRNEQRESIDVIGEEGILEVKQ